MGLYTKVMCSLRAIYMEMRLAPILFLKISIDQDLSQTVLLHRQAGDDMVLVSDQLSLAPGTVSLVSGQTWPPVTFHCKQYPLT